MFATMPMLWQLQCGLILCMAIAVRPKGAMVHRNEKLSHGDRTITSDNYPLPYPANQNFTWLCESKTLIWATIMSDFQLEECTGSTTERCDRLEFDDGKGGVPLRYTSLSPAKLTDQKWGNYIKISFFSDNVSRGTSKGFKIHLLSAPNEQDLILKIHSTKNARRSTGGDDADDDSRILVIAGIVGGCVVVIFVIVIIVIIKLYRRHGNLEPLTDRDAFGVRRNSGVYHSRNSRDQQTTSELVIVARQTHSGPLTDQRVSQDQQQARQASAVQRTNSQRDWKSRAQVSSQSVNVRSNKSQAGGATPDRANTPNPLDDFGKRSRKISQNGGGTSNAHASSSKSCHAHQEGNPDKTRPNAIQQAAAATPSTTFSKDQTACHSLSKSGADRTCQANDYTNISFSMGASSRANDVHPGPHSPQHPGPSEGGIVFNLRLCSSFAEFGDVVPNQTDYNSNNCYENVPVVQDGATSDGTVVNALSRHANDQGNRHVETSCSSIKAPSGGCQTTKHQQRTGEEKMAAGSGVKDKFNTGSEVKGNCKGWGLSSSLGLERRLEEKCDGQANCNLYTNLENVHQASKSREGMQQRHQTSEGMQQRHQTSEGIQQRHQISEGIQQRHQTSEGIQQRHQTSEGIQQRHQTSEGIQQRHQTSEGMQQRDQTSEGMEQRHQTSEGMQQRHQTSEGMQQTRAVEIQSDDVFLTSQDAQCGEGIGEFCCDQRNEKQRVLLQNRTEPKNSRSEVYQLNTAVPRANSSTSSSISSPGAKRDYSLEYHYPLPQEGGADSRVERPVGVSGVIAASTSRSQRAQQMHAMHNLKPLDDGENANLTNYVTCSAMHEPKRSMDQSDSMDASHDVNALTATIPVSNGSFRNRKLSQQTSEEHYSIPPCAHDRRIQEDSITTEADLPLNTNVPKWDIPIPHSEMRSNGNGEYHFLMPGISMKEGVPHSDKTRKEYQIFTPNLSVHTNEGKGDADENDNDGGGGGGGGNDGNTNTYVGVMNGEHRDNSASGSVVAADNDEGNEDDDGNDNILSPRTYFLSSKVPKQSSTSTDTRPIDHYMVPSDCRPRYSSNHREHSPPYQLLNSPIPTAASPSFPSPESKPDVEGQYHYLPLSGSRGGKGGGKEDAGGEGNTSIADFDLDVTMPSATSLCHDVNTSQSSHYHVPPSQPRAIQTEGNMHQLL